MNLKVGKKIITFAFSLFILSLFINSMWNFSVQYATDRMSLIDVYPDATSWISQNLHEDELAIIPVDEVFLSLNPDLNHQTKSYKSFWKDAEVDIIHGTEEEKNLVRQIFWNYVSLDDNNVRYVVVSLHDIFMKSIFDIHQKEFLNLELCSTINSNMKEAKRFNIEVSSTNWKSSLVICETK